MWRLLTSELDVLVHSGSVYLPVLFDPDIEAEISALTDGDPSCRTGGVHHLSDTVLCVDGKYFIRSLSLDSLVKHFPVIFPQEYEQQRAALRREFLPTGLTASVPLTGKLKTIIFEILPHFVRTRRGWAPSRGQAAVLSYLAARIPGSRDAKDLETGLRERQRTLQEVCRRLQEGRDSPVPPPGPGQPLSQWFPVALAQHLAAEELQYWSREVAAGEELLQLPHSQRAALLTLAGRQAWEVDGFGCFRDPKYPGEFIVYQKTGEFILKDYFGRLYLFPDCRVGVSTVGPFHPMVLDRYKHPLLRRFAPAQRICLNDFQPAGEFSAPGVIRALEEGLNALFYGYNSRKRNGYNSLDEFGRTEAVVVFDDWRLPRDDPRLRPGGLEVKNESY